MNFKRDESHCYTPVITKDGQWQKGEIIECKLFNMLINKQYYEKRSNPTRILDYRFAYPYQ